ncbi:FAD-dependent oxidoreductase [Niveispirillum sp. KHB5.9]|uniref:FAD-dependent oxidoreductase n=1 Tax=Niveispirillum sp. KHB5.9 TaxID=3400269 RepID=UPI003A87D418
MLTDLLCLPPDQEFTADVAIIGAGAAGIALALRLAREGTDVCLIESGGAALEQDLQNLNSGENVGLPYYPLDVTRNRVLGGTTATWSGRCVPLDPIDFRRRDWVPHSGWPVTAADLAADYHDAAEFCGVGEARFNELWQEAGLEDPGFDPDLVQTRFWRMKAQRFGETFRAELENSPRVRSLLHGTVVNIDVAGDARRVTGLRLATPSGTRHRVRARHYVLAAGGIENARLLLASTDVETAGIGNGRDLVGRFFMEHPKCRTARVRTDDPVRLLERLRTTYPRNMPPLCPSLVLSERKQTELEVLNSSIALYYRSLPGVTDAATELNAAWKKGQYWPAGAGRNLLRLLPVLPSVPGNLFRRFVRRRALIAQPTALYLLVRGEQAPNPDSRVGLSEARDRLGQRRADLDWRLSPLDKLSARAVTELVGKELSRTGLGRIDMDDWLFDGSPNWPTGLDDGDHHDVLQGGHHHIGTTRMSADPSTGVVDANGKVWGKENLFVAGSSVFPTSGWANPTLTIVALSLRLGAHLEQRLLVAEAA